MYYTVNKKNRDKKEVENNEYESIESDYNNNDDFMKPNHFVGINALETTKK